MPGGVGRHVRHHPIGAALEHGHPSLQRGLGHKIELHISLSRPEL